MSEAEIKDPVLYALNLKAIKLEMAHLKLKKKFEDYKKAVKAQIEYFAAVMEDYEDTNTDFMKNQIRCLKLELKIPCSPTITPDESQN